MSIEPIGTTIFSPAMAIRFGRNAAEDGLQLSENPYDECSAPAAFAAWRKGFMELAGAELTLLRQKYSYDPVTGAIVGKSGKRLGSVDRSGSRYITAIGRRYRADRLAFLLMTGREPMFIEHLDGDPLNDVWNNLQGF